MTAVVFDLDDTLYKEADYVKSGYDYVARRLARKLRVPVSDLRKVMDRAVEEGVHPFDALYEHIDRKVSVKRMVEWYRNHVPYLILPEESRRTLEQLRDAGCVLAMITDGRKVGQWNKIHALGIDRFIKRELISVSGEIGADKTDEKPWLRMMELTGGCDERWYVGDNPRKDFMHPRRLGWHTVMLKDDGRDIKSQDVDLPDGYRAEYSIDKLSDLPALIAKK